MNCQALQTVFRAAPRCWGVPPPPWLSGFFDGNIGKAHQGVQGHTDQHSHGQAVSTPQLCAYLVLNAASMHFPSEERPG